jgi:negative regulator of sigma E activity
MTMRVWRSGVRRRVEFLAPQIMRGDLLVDDGTNVWLYHRADNTAVQAKTASAADSLERISRLSKAEVLGSATIAGRPAWIVAVSSGPQNRVVRKFWVDKATKARLRVQHFNAKGKNLENIALQSVEFGPVASARFRWTPPDGTKTTVISGTLYIRLKSARAAVSWLQDPAEIWNGYVFESAIADPNGEVWLRYTNGLSRFSIFQERTADTSRKPLKQVDGGWYWQRDGSRFVVVGLSGAEVQKLKPLIRRR